MTDRKSNFTTPCRELRARTGARCVVAWAILPAVLLAVHLLAVGRVSGQVVTGRRGTADMRSVVNMGGLVYLEKALHLTNRPPRAIHLPQPVTSVETQQVAGGTSPAGGGFTAASAPGEPSFTAASIPPPGISPPVATSFQAVLDNNTVIPPDTHGAVGPNHVMTVLNSEVRIQDRNGAIISTVSLDNFWRTVGNPVAFDPKLLYDPYNQRWMFTACANAISEQSSLLIGVTQTSDPTGNWNLYRVDADPANIDWADYPSIGFNKDWIVVSVNMFPIGIGLQTYSGENIYVFNKTNLYANGNGQFTLLKDTSLKGFTYVPAITYDNTLSTMYLVQVDNLLPALANLAGGFPGVSRLQISTITGPVGSEVLDISHAFTPHTNSWQAADLFTFFGGSGLQQGLPSFFFGIDLGDSRMQNVVYRNGSLWCTHSFFLPLEITTFAPFHSGVQWWQITPSGQVEQFGRIEDPLGLKSYAYPSIAVNRCNDVLIGFSSFATNQFASADYSFRYSSDAPSTLRAPARLKDGEAPYFKTFGGFVNRWGDYSSTVVDPVNDVDMWTIQEYAAQSFFPTNIIITNLFNFGNWGTWWGRIDVIGSSTNQILFSSGSYRVSEAAPLGRVLLTVLNPGGLAGTVEYATADGTAVAGVDYRGIDLDVLIFGAGELSKTIEVDILDNADINSNKTFTVTLSNPTGGAALGCLSTTVVTIEDDESLSLPNEAGEFVFSTFLNRGIPYIATENESGPNPFCGNTIQQIIQPDRNAPGVIVTVIRTNGSTGRMLVDFSTPAGGSAIAGVDYYPTNGTLVFDDFQTSATFLVRTRNDVFLTFGFAFFADWVRVALSNPRPAPEEEAARPGVLRPRLGNGSESGILIWNINGGTVSGTGTNVVNWWNIERANYRTDEYSVYGTNGGTRTINVDVTLFPLGGPGSVDLIVSSVGGTQIIFGDPLSSSLRSPDPDFKPVLNAGSDKAEAFENQGLLANGTQQPFSINQVWPNPIYLDPSQDTITNSSDYLPFVVTLPFGNGRCRRSVSIVITNDNKVEFNEDFIIGLRGGNPNLFGPNLDATVTILQDDPPAGSVDREWNPDNASPSFRSTPGANYMVSAVAIQPDGKAVFGGDFDRVNSEVRNHVARMNLDGSLDTSFQPGGGADGFVSSITCYSSNGPFAGRILIAGGFQSYNSQDSFHVARLLGNGSLDTAFANATGTGANAPVRAMVLQADGRIVIAGDFTMFDGVDRQGLARLNPDGSLDPTFNVVGGTDGIIWGLALQPDGLGGEKVLVAGDYSNIDGEFRGGIARLNTDGTVDLSFDPGAGADGTIYAVTVQTNRQILIAGDFGSINAINRSRVARLQADGVLDLSFDPGTGPDSSVFAITLQTDGKAVLGGLFTSYNYTRRVGLARLLADGSLDTSFMDTAYNQFAGLINDFSFEPANFINSIAIQADGNMIIGGSFTKVGGNPSVNTPLRNNYTVFTRADKRIRYNIARIVGGVTPGPGNASYNSKDYFTDEQAGTAYLEVVRTDGRLGTLSASSFPSNRLATAGQDYGSNIVQAVWPEAYYMTNFLSDFPTNYLPVSVGFISPLYVPVPLLDDSLQEGDELVDMRFFRPSASLNLGGEVIPLGGALGRASSTLTIADNDAPRGVIAFKSAQYFTNEFNGFARITVIRTNGSNGRVTARWTTSTAVGSPATPGRDYQFKTDTVVFNSGITEQTFDIQILNDTDVEFDENVGLVLSDPGQGATLPGGAATTSAILTIIDTDVIQGRLNFASPIFTTNEDAGAVIIGVTRTGGSQSAISVQYTTLNGTATAPADFTAVSGTLNWDALDTTTKLITVPLVADGTVDNPSGTTESFSVRLFNPRIGATLNTLVIGNYTNSTVVIQDADAYGTLAFSQPRYETDENGGAAMITVVRRDGLSGIVSADFSVAPIGDTTTADYVPTGGTLTFQSGESSKSFAITLLDDSQPDGNKDLRLTLSNPVNATLGVPSVVTNRIVDNESVNIPAGEFDTTFKTNTQINGPVYSVALQPDGRILVAGEFSEVNNVTRSSVARLDADGTLDTGLNPGAGPNGAVRSMVLQPDGRILLGGFFNQYNGTNRNGITRINSDGVLDASFNPGAGANNPVYALVLQPDRKILVAGAFSSFGGTNIPGLVRLNTNGTVDHTFATSVGANNTVYALGLQPDGKVIVGGEFNAIGGQFHPYLARLNRNGSVDATFNPVLDGPARAVLVQPDGRIVVGGSFVTANGIARSRLARFNSDGTLDTNFLASPLIGADSVVLALAQQVDGKVIVAGDFRRFNGVTRNRLTRLNTDGTTDPTINFGNGADSFVGTVVIQPDRKIVFGGGFSMFDDEPRQRIARIYGGSVAGNGALEFSKPEFVVQENSTNAMVIIRRRLGTTGAVGANYQTLDGTAVAGVDYTAVAGTVSFPEGETRTAVLIPVTDNSLNSGVRTFTVELVDGSFTGGAVPGPDPSTRVVIVDDEGLIKFRSADFSTGENAVGGFTTIDVDRVGGTNNLATVNFSTANGTATAPADYLSTNGTLVFLPGETSKRFRVPIINDTLIEPGETVLLTLSAPSGSNALGIASATLLISDNEFGFGQFTFGAPSYVVTESSTNVVLTILRTNGYSGIVSVRYQTADFSASAGLDYVATNNIISFPDGEFVRTIEIPILDDLLVEPQPEFFSVVLLNPTGGAQLGAISTAQVRINDNDVSLIEPVASTLVFESGPVNSAIDPGENVTVALALQNRGSGNTSNLVATLLPGNGVTSITVGTQVFGVLVAGGPAVSRNFSFTASGNNGDRLLATLLLTDATFTNGFVSFPFTIGGQASRSFGSTNRITINDFSAASPYPSTITVANMGGTITRLSVNLTNFAHRYPGDVDVLLIGPGGQRVTLMSDAGSTASQPNPVTNVMLRFDALAATAISETGPLVSGTYRPANYAGPFNTADQFDLPAPQPVIPTDPRPYSNTNLLVFNGTGPNGIWSLFVMDDELGQVGSINGWSLDIQTADPVVAPINLALSANGGANPVALGATVNSVVTVTNKNANLATEVVLVDQMPSGLALVAANASAGTWDRVGSTVRWKVGSLPGGASATMTMVTKPTTVGSLTSTFNVGGQQADINLADNSAATVTTVVPGAVSLSVIRQGNSVQLSWPANAGMILQWADHINSPNWTDVGATYDVLNNQNLVSLNVGAANKFFRLRAGNP